MEISFKILSSYSLKDKRRVVKSIIDKSKRMFNISIAEVDDNDIVNYVTLGIACVSNDKTVVESTFDKILSFCESNFDIEITSARKEFV